MCDGCKTLFMADKANGIPKSVCAERIKQTFEDGLRQGGNPLIGIAWAIEHLNALDEVYDQPQATSPMQLPQWQLDAQTSLN